MGSGSPDRPVCTDLARKAPTSTAQPGATRNLDGYGTASIEWQGVLGELEGGYTQAADTGGPNRHTMWLATTNPDGTPHVMPVGSGWVDGGFWFTSGPDTRKSRNLADNPACVITVATHRFDIVAEGRATRVTDEPTLQKIAAVCGSSRSALSRVRIAVGRRPAVGCGW